MAQKHVPSTITATMNRKMTGCKRCDVCCYFNARCCSCMHIPCQMTKEESTLEAASSTSYKTPCSCPPLRVQTHLSHPLSPLHSVISLPGQRPLWMKQLLLVHNCHTRHVGSNGRLNASQSVPFDTSPRNRQTYLQVRKSEIIRCPL